MVSFEVNVKEFDRAMNLYASVMEKSAGEAVRDQTGLLCRDLIHYTWPNSNRHSAKKQGEEAVKRDITAAVQPQEWKKWGQPHIQKMIRKKDYDAFNAYLQNSKTMHMYRAERFIPELHTNARNKQYDVKHQNVMTLHTADWKRYVREVQSHIGRLKSTWLPPLLYLRNGKQLNKIPSWITRHTQYAHGITRFQDMTRKEDPSFIIYNSTAGAWKLKGTVEVAMKGRALNMTKQVLSYLNALQKKTLTQLEAAKNNPQLLLK